MLPACRTIISRYLYLIISPGLLVCSNLPRSPAGAHNSSLYIYMRMTGRPEIDLAGEPAKYISVLLDAIGDQDMTNN